MSEPEPDDGAEYRHHWVAPTRVVVTHPEDPSRTYVVSLGRSGWYCSCWGYRKWLHCKHQDMAQRFSREDQMGEHANGNGNGTEIGVVHTGPIQTVPVQTAEVKTFARPGKLGPDKLELLKRTIAKGTTDDEFALFVSQCERTGLDPFTRQIHAVKRWDSREKREVMTIQTGIDGYRLIADRTDRYCPGREPTYEYDQEGRLVSATAFVRKYVAGVWHEVSDKAFYREFVQTTKEGKPNRFWALMPHVMLSKVAEARALRRCFPQDLSGIYTDEEMGQADAIEERRQAQIAAKQQQALPPPTLSEDQVRELEGLYRGHLADVRKTLDHWKAKSLRELPATVYEPLKKKLLAAPLREPKPAPVPNFDQDDPPGVEADYEEVEV